MTSLDLVISNYLSCDRRELYEKLKNTSIHSKVVQHFEGRLLVTTYKNKEGKYKEFILKDVSYKGADEQYAYNGFMDITVKQHFFARHEIKLRFPYNLCAIEITGKKINTTIIFLWKPSNLFHILKQKDHVQGSTYLTIFTRRIIESIICFINLIDSRNSGGILNPTILMML